MKQDLAKRFLSSALALSLCVSMLPTAFAGEDTDEVTVTEDTSSSSSQSTYATLTAEALMFNLTVPTAIPISVDSAGRVTTGTNFYVKNNSVAPVDITNVEVTAQNNWTLVDFDTDFTKEKVDLQEYGISFFDDEASSSGAVSLNSSNWGSITGGNTLTIGYDANVAAQSDSIDDKVIGLVELTIGWSDTVTYGGSESEVADISLYYNYSYTDSQGNETDTAGYVVTLTEEFAAVVNSADATFTVDGEVLWSTGDALPNPGSMYNGVPVTSYARMFYNYTEMTSVDVSGWDISNVTDMQNMFQYSNITSLDSFSDWNVSNVNIMTSMFKGCSGLANLDGLSDWDVRNVTAMGAIFNNCSILTNIDALADWDTSNVTVMNYIFSGCTSLLSVDAISDWDTSSVTTMASMFRDCSSLTSINSISEWDISSVTDMTSIFRACTSLTTLDLSGWDMSNVTTTTNMFHSCSILSTIHAKSEADADILNALFSYTCTYYIGSADNIIDCYLYIPD